MLLLFRFAESWSDPYNKKLSCLCLEKDHTKRNINSKIRKAYVGNQ